MKLRDKLYPRELELVSHLYAGRTVKQGAHEMGISYQTAKTYVINARQIVGASSMFQLGAWYQRYLAEQREDRAA